MQGQTKYTNVLHLGRGPLFTDVIIDSMGVLLGILIVMLVVKIYKKIEKRQKVT